MLPQNLEPKLMKMKILEHRNSPFTDKKPQIILVVKSHFYKKDIEHWTKEIENMDAKIKDFTRLNS